MSALTQLNENNIDTLLTPFGLTHQSLKLLSGGSENSNYLVATEKGDFVITICEQKSLQSCRELVSLLDFLQSQGFNTSQVIKTLEGEPISLWEGKGVIVKSYIAGAIIKDIPNETLAELGVQLARLHNLKAPSYLPKTVSYGKEKFVEVAKYAANCDFDIWLQMITQKLASVDLSQLPKCLVHSDIFYNNIIIDEDCGQATIMDFEEASYYYRVFDIGMMIIGTCVTDERLSLSKAHALLTGYQSQQSLLTCEIQALQLFTVYAAAGTAFWRHMNYNFTNYEESMTEHYQAMQSLADQALAIPEASFIAQLGLS